MGTAPAALDGVIAEMLALQKALPQRPSFLELEIAVATIAKVDDALAVRREELMHQARPEGILAIVFGALQDMRLEAAENKAIEQKKEAEEVVELEERHRKYDTWIRKVHMALSSEMSLESGEDADADADGAIVSPVSTKVGSQTMDAQGSARSVLDAVWDFPPSESSVSSAGLLSSSVHDQQGAKPNSVKSSTYGRSDSFSSVAQSLSWTGEQSKLDAPTGEHDAKYFSFPVLDQEGGPKRDESNALVLQNVKKTVGVLSMLDSATKQQQTCLDLRGAFLKEIEWVPESIGRMIWLTDLNLSGNRLTILPDSIGDLSNLVNLDVCTNQLVVLPESIGRLTCLKTLLLDNNKIEELPYTIGQCISLTELKASFNQLKALPEATGKLTQLRCLDVHWNKLGSLPSTIASMESLVDLDASFNEIHHVPEGLCQVTTLTRLNLASNFNELQEIPQGIGNLQKLKLLNLSCNQLKVLPDSFALLTNLQDLDLSGNHWRVPPKNIADQGLEAVLKYMANLVTEKEKGKAVVPKRSMWTLLCFTCGEPSVIETDLVA